MFPSRRDAAMAVVAAVALTALTACTGPDRAEPPASSAEPVASAAEAATAEVVIDTFIFDPDPLTVSPGTIVIFENRDSTTHTITAGTREAPRPTVMDARLSQTGTASWTMAEAGTYDYFCSIHNGPGMTGRILVGA